jgi:integrase
MSRKRNPENKGLPSRWRFLKNAYYYDVPEFYRAKWDNKRLFRLGSTQFEAYKEWALRLERIEIVKDVGDLLDEYAKLVVPTKAVACHQCQYAYIKKLKEVFGSMPIESLRPKHIYAFSKGCLDGGKTSGRGEIEVLRHACTKAVEWGYIDTHPFIGQVRLARPEPRDRYIEDWEVQEMFTLNCRRKKGSVAMIQAYLRLKMMTGMARGDLLRLTTANFGDSGIPIQRHKTAKKTGKRTIYLWTPDLRVAIDAAIKARPCLSPFLFCNSKGHSYLNEETGRADGFDSMWGRFVDRVLKETKVTRRFTEHDFRAKTASDAESSDHARALLSHVDVNTTNRVYRRKPETVTPLKSVV